MFSDSLLEYVVNASAAALPSLQAIGGGEGQSAANVNSTSLSIRKTMSWSVLKLKGQAAILMNINGLACLAKLCS
jgi:hypothetical protein